MTPDKFTITEEYLDVGHGHQLYVQDWGNPDVKNVFLFIHGGPGDSVQDKHKNRFNPFEQRIIFFDQRGCGRSTPYGSLEHNTTAELVDDIEKVLRSHSVNNVILVGGSWGACLALAFALKYPSLVKAIVIQGVFTGTEAEIDFLDKGMFQSFFPDVWDHFLENTPKAHRLNPVAYHFSRILGDEPETARASAHLYSSMEGSLLSLDDRYSAPDFATFDPLPTKIEVHYLSNRCFMPNRFILINAHKLTMPVWIVQGRYDFVCPPQTAYALHHAIAGSTLIWTMAGHGNDRSNYDVVRTVIAQW